MVTQKGNSPNEVSTEMLAATYDSLETKDMSKEAFINACKDVMKGKKRRKHSPLILPN